MHDLRLSGLRECTVAPFALFEKSYPKTRTPDSV